VTESPGASFYEGEMPPFADRWHRAMRRARAQLSLKMMHGSDRRACKRIPAQRLAQTRSALLVAAVWLLPSLVISIIAVHEGYLQLVVFLVLWLVPIVIAVARSATLICDDALAVRSLMRSHRLPWSHIRAARFKKDGGWLDLEVLLEAARGSDRWIRIAEVPSWLDRDIASPPVAPKRWPREVSILAAVTKALAAHEVKLEALTDDLESPLHAIVVPFLRAALGPKLLIDIGRHPIVEEIWSRDAAWREGMKS